MPRTKKKYAGRPRKERSRSFLDDPTHEEVDDQDLPNDEAGRLKVKRNYEELLGIRVEKLKGRVLNREKINKNIDGVYFICVECKVYSFITIFYIVVYYTSLCYKIST